jgi:hypothetical protein
MAFTETLFGGLLAIVALYFTMRRFGLSNYWSALLAGALPFLTYLGYSMSHGFAGDVLAIHLAVFMATAGVLGVFGGAQRKNEKMHWAPKLLIAFFAMLVVFNAALLTVSMHGLPSFIFEFFLPKHDNQIVHTAFPGSVPHDRNKLYEPHQQRLEQQRQLGWKVVPTGLDQLHQNATSKLVIHIADKDSQPVAGAKVSLALWRMANSLDDRRFELREDKGGEYAVTIKLANAGKWIADIYIERGKDSYVMQQPVIVAE